MLLGTGIACALAGGLQLSAGRPLLREVLVYLAVALSAVLAAFLTWLLYRLRQERTDTDRQATELGDELARHRASIADLEERTGFLTRVFENNPDALLVVDEAGTIRSVNQRAVELFGYTRDELEGTPVERLVPSEVAARHPSLRADYARNPRFRPLNQGRDLAAMHADGSRLPVDISLGPIHTPDGLLVVVGVRDVHERVEAQAALRESQTRYRRFFAGNVAATYVTRVDGTLIDCNRAFLELLDLGERKAALGVDVSKLYASPVERRRLVETLRREGSVMGLELLLKTPGDRVVVVVANIAARLDDDGEPVEFMGFLRDVTAERELRGHVERLQRIESVGSLATGIAHDFNNLLTTILASASLLEDDGLSPEQREARRHEIVRAAEGGAQLTRRLLRFARRQSSDAERLSIRDTLTRWEPVLRRLAGAGVELRMDVTDDPHVELDPGHLEQIVLNLVANARDAMPRGGKLTVSVAARNGAQSPLVRLSVADTGRGIDESVRDELFAPFVTSKPDGTGLGLATVKTIVGECGGDVTFETELGVGTTFHVDLPAVA